VTVLLAIQIWRLLWLRIVTIRIQYHKGAAPAHLFYVVCDVSDLVLLYMYVRSATQCKDSIRVTAVWEQLVVTLVSQEEVWGSSPIDEFKGWISVCGVCASTGLFKKKKNSVWCEVGNFTWGKGWQIILIILYNLIIVYHSDYHWFF
jgi:hypothetical protein